jgi:DNA-3-methyladenine glycosylase
VRSRALPAAFYARSATAVARDLLGQIVVSEIGGRRCVGRVVEVEAYTGPRDPASHAAGWHRSARNEAMYGPPGRAYVYFTYGMHWCLNVVTGRAGYPSAVLVRALEPLEGLEVMRRRRGGVADRLLMAGPARLTEALGVTGREDGHPLDRAPLWIGAGETVPQHLRRRATRVGILHAAHRKLRFLVRRNPFVSRP